MTVEEREQLVKDYIEEVLDTCDMGFLLDCTANYLEENVSELSDAEFLADVRDFYPHLLGEE